MRGKSDLVFCDPTGMLTRPEFEFYRNVLKDRRNEQLQQDVAESSTSALQTAKSVPERMLPPPVPINAAAPRRPASPKESDRKKRGFWVGYRTEVTDMESYHARWKARSICMSA